MIHGMTITERQTQYVKTADGAHIGYQVFGTGQRDLLFVTNWLQNLDAMWEEPSLARYLDRLATFARVICVDKRGHGISDPVPTTAIPTLDLWIEDLRAVLDAAGSTETTILGDTEGGPLAMLFAATFPERVSSLVLVNTFARWQRAEDYPIGMPADATEKVIGLFEGVWGRDNTMLILTAPEAFDDARFRSWFTAYQRLCMPPGGSTALYRWILGLDVRHVLPSIQVPTLVLHGKDNIHHRIDHGRYLVERIPDSRFVELDGSAAVPFHAGDTTALLDAIEEFVTGERHTAATDRMLSTVLFTDIVGSTDMAASVGDQQWLDLLQVHNRVSAEHVERFRGQLRKNTGDGVLATFDGPASAVTCASRLVKAVQELGIQIRAGLHTGEIVVRDSEVGGIGVHIASRVMSKAKDGRVAVSSTVRDLAIGSGFSFEPAGVHELKGVPGEWAIFDIEESR